VQAEDYIRKEETDYYTTKIDEGRRDRWPERNRGLGDRRQPEPQFFKSKLPYSDGSAK
jgi:hypothetical protein